jgi:hypothetical protein
MAISGRFRINHALYMGTRINLVRLVISCFNLAFMIWRRDDGAAVAIRAVGAS